MPTEDDGKAGAQPLPVDPQNKQEPSPPSQPPPAQPVPPPAVSAQDAGGGPNQPQPTVDLEEKPGVPITVPGPPPTKDYNLVAELGAARKKIAYFLISILAGIVVFSFVFLWFKVEKSDQLNSLLVLIFSPIVALVGAATGYYFGAASTTSTGTK